MNGVDQFSSQSNLQESRIIDEKFGLLFMKLKPKVVKAKKNGEDDVYIKIIEPQIQKLCKELRKSHLANLDWYQSKVDHLAIKTGTSLLYAENED